MHRSVKSFRHLKRPRRLTGKSERATFLKDICIPLSSALIALAAVISTTIIQVKSLDSQRRLKIYEVSFKPKQDGYSEFMKNLYVAFECTYQGIHPNVVRACDELQIAYYTFKPFLTDSERKATWEKYQQFQEWCLSHVNEDKSKKDVDSFVNSFIEYKNYFRERLYTALFRRD